MMNADNETLRETLQRFGVKLYILGRLDAESEFC